MTIIPVSLDDTFDQWRTKTNELIVQNEQTESAAVGAFNRANTANALAISVSAASNSYTNAVGSSANSRSEALYVTGLIHANSVGFSSNSRSNVIGTASNTFAVLIGISSNNYATSIGTAGNSFAELIGTSGNSYSALLASISNTRAASIGTSGNSYATAVGTAANTNAANASYMSTGTVLSARLTGSYTGITGTGTIGTGVWQGTPVAVAYGGTGATTADVARTNLGIGNNATRNVVISTSAAPVSGGNSGDIWIQYNP